MSKIHVVKRDGSTEELSVEKIHAVTAWGAEGLNVSQSELEVKANIMFYDGIKTTDIHNALILSAQELIKVGAEDYTFYAARLMLQKLYKEVAGSTTYPSLESYILKGVKEKRLTQDLLGFNLAELDKHIDQKRDLLFAHTGLQTVIDRYLIRESQVSDSSGKQAKIIELPQHFIMRVAMGLAVNEKNRTEKAIEFYNVLSQLEFMSSTPTLFNAGTLHPQLSSCYLNTVADQISTEEGEHRYASIFGTIEESARLSKYAGGIGTDWNRVRSAGEVIESTNGKSSGVVPYLKIYNGTAVAVNQGGKRNGAFAPYLEPWHPDFYDFIDLKKNSGDENRRTHEIFPAAWAPDLFFKRVLAKGVWSFFAPNKFPELHELHGEAFEKRYEELEALGLFNKQVPAEEVWRKWLGSLFETGHPWVTFKDECNRRNPQNHVGVIHNSNLCTEITLNTSDEETAVCNLGSINMSRITDMEHLKRVTRTAMRMLDNVVDINFYPSDRARTANLKHRPVGLGVMGYTEWLVKNGIDWESDAHIEAADTLFEHLSYYAIEASMLLAEERGAYETFKGSKWSNGILPIHTARDKTTYLGMEAWESLARQVMAVGMRNSNTMAIAPTATIANIVGTTPTIEPIFKRSYTKTNLSGTFDIVDPCLKYGRPELCKESFEIAPGWVIEAAAARQKWIDQAQSINIWVTDKITGPELSNIYMSAWSSGLKTTYYLRNQSTELAKAGATPLELPKQEEVAAEQEPAPKMCSIDNPDCESCQ